MKQCELIIYFQCYLTLVQWWYNGCNAKFANLTSARY